MPLGSVFVAPGAGVVATLVILLTGAVAVVVVTALEALALAVVAAAVAEAVVAVEAVLRRARRATNAARHVSGICFPSSTPPLITFPLLPTAVQPVLLLPSALALDLQPMYL